MTKKQYEFYFQIITQIDIPFIIDIKFSLYTQRNDKIFFKPIGNDVSCFLYHKFEDNKDWNTNILDKKLFSNGTEELDLSKTYSLLFHSHYHNKNIKIQINMIHVFQYLGILNLKDIEIEFQLSTLNNNSKSYQIKSKVLKMNYEFFKRIVNINFDSVMIKKGDFDPIDFYYFSKYNIDDIYISEIFIKNKVTSDSSINKKSDKHQSYQKKVEEILNHAKILRKMKYKK